jgi:hypothetical protein
MAYNDFTLEALKEQFGLRTDEHGDLFSPVATASLSHTLRTHLQKYVPLALAIGTEKARSELIIAPVLVEVIEQAPQRIAFFSGIEFSPDPERGLRGTCDYLLSLSAEQLTVEAPVVTIVEAKNENIKAGITQCIAEMVAAQVFNRSRHRPIRSVYGAVTTGSAWRFLRLEETVVYIDRTEYHISQAEKIVGILLAMLREAGEEENLQIESTAPLPSN